MWDRHGLKHPQPPVPLLCRDKKLSPESSHSFRWQKWRDICVGDIVRLRKDSVVPVRAARAGCALGEIPDQGLILLLSPPFFAPQG